MIMGERYTVVDGYSLNYEGLFSVKELYKIIDGIFKELGYDKVEVNNVEVIKPEGKYVEIKLEPYKRLTDYASLSIEILIIMENVKDVEVEKGKHKMKLNQGSITMIIDGYVDTDYENRWETTPLLFFLRVIADKYIYRPFTSGYNGQCKKDVNHVVDRIKSFLNLYKY